MTTETNVSQEPCEADPLFMYIVLPVLIQLHQEIVREKLTNMTAMTERELLANLFLLFLCDVLVLAFEWYCWLFQYHHLSCFHIMAHTIFDFLAFSYLFLYLGLAVCYYYGSRVGADARDCWCRGRCFDCLFWLVGLPVARRVPMEPKRNA